MKFTILLANIFKLISCLLAKDIAPTGRVYQYKDPVIKVGVGNTCPICGTTCISRSTCPLQRH